MDKERKRFLIEFLFVLGCVRLYEKEIERQREIEGQGEGGDIKQNRCCRGAALLVVFHTPPWGSLLRRTLAYTPRSHAVKQSFCLWQT